MTAQLIKEEQERIRKYEEQFKDAQEEEILQEINFQVDESQVTEMDESKESLESFEIVMKEQLV